MEPLDGLVGTQVTVTFTDGSVWTYETVQRRSEVQEMLDEALLQGTYETQAYVRLEGIHGESIYLRTDGICETQIRATVLVSGDVAEADRPRKTPPPKRNPNKRSTKPA